MLNCIMNKLLTKNEGVYQMGLVSEYGVMMGKFAFKKFNGYTSKAMETQLESLMKILDRNKDCELGKKYGFADIHSFEEYQDKVPLSTFEDYAPLIDKTVLPPTKLFVTVLLREVSANRSFSRKPFRIYGICIAADSCRQMPVRRVISENAVKNFIPFTGRFFCR